MGRVRVRRVAAVAVLLTTVACTGGGEPPPRPETSEPDSTGGLDLGDCGDLVDLASVEMPADRADALTFECGVLQVPLDHDAPAGEELGIQVVRIRDSRQTERIGSLVMNPGGPGQSGLDYAPYWASWISDDVLQRFDVVTFDPRGVGASGGFNCPDIPQADEPDVLVDLTSADGYAFAVDVSREQAAACIGELGADRAAHINTQDTARDLDLLREALGDDQLTYLGFSYGAKLGAEYARQFPDRVRGLVLDAPSHPRHDPIEIVERQVAAFEAAYDAWAEDCPARPTCELLDGDARRFVAYLRERARETPIPSGRPVGDTPATDATVMNAVTALLYDEQAWGGLDQALDEAARGDSGALHEAVENATGRARDPDEPDAMDASLVINCTDARRGPSKATILAAARRLEATYPVYGTFGSFWLVGCKYWDNERLVLPPPEDVGAPPIVVIGTRGDPATPYSGAVAMARMLGSGRLLTWEGKTHTAYGQTDCITDLVDAYLVDLVVPGEGTVCPG